MMRIALHGDINVAQNYIELIQNSDHFLLSGIFPENQSLIPYKNFIDQPANILSTAEDLIRSSDAVFFLNYKDDQIELLKKSLKESRHIFLSSEIILTPELINIIQKLGDEAGVLYYLRHNILNSKFQKELENRQESPEFIDVYRYIPVDIQPNLLDIHKIISRELMFVFSVNNRELKKYKITTVPYCSDAPYIVNIRFDFSNSSTTNLTINLFTHDNTRYTELFYNKNMIRMNTNPGIVEYINREHGNYHIARESYNYKDENKLSEEMKRFLQLLSEKKYPVDFGKSGLSVHMIIWNIINQISKLKTNPV